MIFTFSRKLSKQVLNFVHKMHLLIVLGLLYLLAEVKSTDLDPQAERNCTVRFYEHIKFGGKYLEFNENCDSCEDLPYEWRYKASSIQMYRDPGQNVSYRDLHVFSQLGCKGVSRVFSLMDDKECLEDLTYTKKTFMGIKLPHIKDCGDNWNDKPQSYQFDKRVYSTHKPEPDIRATRWHALHHQ